MSDWAERITAAWRQSVDGIFEAGRLLVAAKADPQFHNQFGKMIEEDLPFGQSTANKLMAIALDPRLSDHGPKMPPNWRTIYELTTLDDDLLNELLANGTINPEVERNQILQFKRIKAAPAPLENGCIVADLDKLIDAGKKFGVIYADPPWEFKVYSGNGKSRSADRHYIEDKETGKRTLSIEDLKKLPVEQLAAEDCALFLWAVMPELPGALEVLKAWGFTYKTVAFVWVKQNQSDRGLHWGMGYWTRANAELCLLGTRGSPQRLAKDVHQIIMSPVGSHSRKPQETHVRIERLVGGPYLEMFARRPMEHWAVWGNDIPRGLFHQSITNFEDLIS